QDVMSKLIADASKEVSEGCPNCKNPMKPGSAICLRCGFNRESGQQFRTTVKKPDKVKEDRAQRGPGFLQNPGAIGLAALLAIGVPFGLGFVFVPAWYIYILIVVLLNMTVGVYALIASFRTSLVSGLRCLFCGPLYFILFVNDDARLSYLFGVNVAGILGI